MIKEGLRESTGFSAFDVTASFLCATHNCRRTWCWPPFRADNQSGPYPQPHAYDARWFSGARGRAKANTAKYPPKRQRVTANSQVTADSRIADLAGAALGATCFVKAERID